MRNKSVLTAVLIVLVLSLFLSFSSMSFYAAAGIPTVDIAGDKENNKYTSTVSLTFTPASDTDDVYYRRSLNGSIIISWTKATAPVTLTVNGRHTVEYRGQNKTDSSDVSATQNIMIDIELKAVENNEFVVRNGINWKYYKSDVEIKLPTTYEEKTNEVRAVWVSTVSNIDIAQHTSKEQYQNEILGIIDNIAKNNMNTMFFQVRPMNDAFYESDYAPWSKYLAGSEGKDPGWDVLQFVIDESHKRGIEVHAWMNPFRVHNASVSPGTAPNKTAILGALDEKNYARQNPNHVISNYNGAVNNGSEKRTEYFILNPGEPKVREYLVNVSKELMEKYNIDGIHFDDYFYPYGGTPAVTDDETMANNNPEGLTKDDWRRNNVDQVIKLTGEAVRKHNSDNNKNVKFGISPFGVWRTKGSDPVNGANIGNASQSYSSQFADSKKWVDEKWIDYICPQLYWEFNHNVAPYADLVDWWAGICDAAGVDLLIGHGFYRSVDTSESGWKDDNELLEQLRYATKFDIIKGHAFFSYKTIISSGTKALQAMRRLNNYYWQEQAGFPWKTDLVIPSYTVSIDTDNNGTFTGLEDREYKYGEEITLTATPKEGYKISKWIINGVSYGANNTITITVTDTLDINIEFVLINEANEPLNLPLIIGLSVGGGVLLIGLSVVAIIIIKKKKGNANPEN